MTDRRELYDDPEESARLAFEGQASQLWTTLPGIIESVNLEAQTVSVQPCIRGTVQDETGAVTQQDMPLLVDVPICWPRAGGFAITFPIKNGDECLVHFSARCIDAWWQSGGIQAAIEDRMHDLSDAFATFAPTSQAKKLTDVQSDGMELRNESRSVFIRLTDSGIFIKGAVTHDGDYVQSGSYSLNGNMTHVGGTIYSLTKRIDGMHTHVSSIPGTDTSAPNA